MLFVFVIIFCLSDIGSFIHFCNVYKYWVFNVKANIWNHEYNSSNIADVCPYYKQTIFNDPEYSTMHNRLGYCFTSLL